MKTKISHLGRSTVSVILAVMMLLSTMLIGTMSTVNAVTKTFETVNLVGNINGIEKWNSTEYPFTFDETTCNWYLDITITQSSEFKARVNNKWDISFGASGNNCTISETGDYRISVKDGAENGTDLTVQKTVNKVADSVTLTANPTSITEGASSTLTATLNNKNSSVGDVTYSFTDASNKEVGKVTTSDSTAFVEVTPSSTTNYKVTATATGYTSVDASTTVTVKTVPKAELLYGNNGDPLNSTTSLSMTYDADTDCFYYVVDSNLYNSNFRFRFAYNNKQYCANWSSYPNSATVNVDGDKVDVNTDVTGYGNKPGCAVGNATSKFTIWFDANNLKTWIVNAEAPKYTVNYDVKGGNGSLTATGVNGSGSSVNSGTTVIFTAAPSEGYAVEGWYSDADCKNAITDAGTKTSYEVTVNANTNVYVKFKSTTIDPEYRLTGDLSAIGGWNGYDSALKFDTAESDGSYSKILTVTSDDANSKHFKLIKSENGSEKYYGPDSAYDIILSNSSDTAYNTFDTSGENCDFYFSNAGTYKIHYIVKTGKNTPSVWVEENTTKYNVTVAENIKSIASVDKTEFAKGETVTVTATPGTGEVLQSVTVVGDDHTPVTTTVSGNTATFTMPDQNVTVTGVTFRTANPYTVEFSSSNDSFGTVSAMNGKSPLTSSPATVTEGDEVIFTAHPKSGYALSGWTVNGVSVSSTTNQYKITVNSNTTVVANFKVEDSGTIVNDMYFLYGSKNDPTSWEGQQGYNNTEYGKYDVYEKDGKYIVTLNEKHYKELYFAFSKDDSYVNMEPNTGLKPVNSVNPEGLSLVDAKTQEYYVGSVQYLFGKMSIVGENSEYIGDIKIIYDPTANTYTVKATKDSASDTTVNITGKDGTIRAGYTDTGASKTTAVLGDTTLSITTPDDKIITASDSYKIDGKNRAVTAKKVPYGSTVTVTTTIDPDATFAGHNGSDYYVKGFSVNGIFGGVLSQTEGKNHSSDVYTYTFEVNQEIYDSSKLEITPVYFLKNDDNCVYFYIENYDSAKQIWGNTPSCYVYYGSGKTTLEALGYYPGQPMVDYNGSIFTQIPKSIVNGDTTEKITGMTLNNYVWDDVHRDYNGKDQKSDNAQTYDYDDFVKIAESGAAADNIIYRFKYNTHDNVPGATLATSDADAAGWEVFLDYQNYPTDIFGNKIGTEKLDYKDTQSVTSKGNYLSIISDGYQNNYIGKYATAWSIYNKAGDRVATIPSSALLYALGKTDAQMETAIGSESTPTDFLPGKDNRDKHWATFKTLYNDYKGVYAQINFEAAIKGGDDYGNRLDGRWYYSQSKQKITGEIKIQYANTLDDYKVGGFHEDTFADEDASSIVGTTTGASAYFTDPADRVRKLETEADNTQDYKFEVNATSTAAYTFVGWYRLIDGDYKAINPSDMSSLTGAVTRNSDVTLVARYIKTPGGSMTFHHSLYNGTNAGGGKATTEIQVVVKNNEGKSLYDSGRIAGTASIDKTKIAELAAQTGLTVTVTLYTTTKNLYNFNGYYSAENTTDITAFDPTTGFTTNVSGDRTEGLVTTSEYTFSFNEYYNKYASTLTAADAGTVYYNFYSDITSIKVPYKVQFSYTDRMGNQKYYNKAGYVDPENTSSYTFDENATNVEGVESHSVKVTLTDSFILSLAPYESNFTKNLTWDNPTDSKPFDSSVSKSIASAVVNSTQSPRTIHLNIYKDSEGKPTPLINDAGQFKLYEKDGSPELPYGSVFYEQNSDGTYKYDITAPKTYTDEDGTHQFMYWAIYSDPGCNNLVINAYNSEGNFSYVAYDNCWIVPVYGESSTPVASVKDVYTSTQFMEVTRNQWTADTNSNFAGFDADSMNTLDTNEDFIKGDGEDKLYADFVLNFFYNGKQLSVFDPDSSKVQTGIVMQKLELEKDSIGVGYNTDMEHYANKYINDLSAAAADAKNKILTGNSSIESLTKQINNDRLDNKNRLQYYARFNNTEANANCVYRVYTYIRYLDESNNPVIKLGDPIYFTLYDIANATV